MREKERKGLWKKGKGIKKGGKKEGERVEERLGRGEWGRREVWRGREGWREREKESERDGGGRERERMNENISQALSSPDCCLEFTMGPPLSFLAASGSFEKSLGLGKFMRY